jgi:putative ABC transport system permease protein
MNDFNKYMLKFVDSPANVIAAAAAILAVVLVVLNWHSVRFVLKSMRRNLLRTVLTGLATMVLVLVVSVVWSVLKFVDDITTEKSKDFKAIITEKNVMPSQIPDADGAYLSTGAFDNKPGQHEVKNPDAMTWQFVIGSTDPDPAKFSFNNIIFFFCMEPSKLGHIDPKTDKFTTMMEDIDQFPDAALRQLAKWCDEMEDDMNKVLVGEDRMRMMNVKVGDKITVYSRNFKDLKIEDLTIIGALPKGRYGQSSVMNRKKLDKALDAYQRANGKEHPSASPDGKMRKSLGLVWLRVPDTDSYLKTADQVEHSKLQGGVEVKCETASSGIGNFLESYRDLLRGMRWLLAPFAMATMAMVIAVAISISVRERRTEMAVLKVLGFSPNQIMMLVLGEAVLIGATSGFVINALAYVLITQVLGGIPFPIAFYPVLPMPAAVLWWGPAIGGGTAILGSLVPAWTARSVKVSEVFSKIA